MSAIVLTCALFCTPLFQEKGTIRLRYNKGDRVSVSGLDKLVGTYTLTSGTQKKDWTQRGESQIAYDDEIVDLDAEGRPNHVRRAVRDWTEKIQLPGQSETTETKTAKGKTLTLKLRGGRTSIEGDTLSPEDRKKIRLSSAILRSLPKGEIAVGFSWAVEEKELIRDFEEDKAPEDPLTVRIAKGGGRLTKLAAGRATVAFDIEASGDNGVGLNTSLRVKATVEIDCRAGRLLSIRSEGTIDVSGKIEQGGQESAVQGKVTFENSSEFRIP